MPNKAGPAGMPHEWLQRARSNLARAGQPKTDEIFLEDLCFDAQQAAEKALKAVLLAKNIPFRYVHDIVELITVLEQHKIPFPEKVRTAAQLTDYAVEVRYPGIYEPVTEDDYQEALQIAGAVVDWAEEILKDI